MKFKLIAALMLSIAALILVASAAADAPEKPLVVLGALPKIELATQPSVTDAEAKHIKKLIASLADLDQAHSTLADDGSGSAFAPVVTRREVEKFSIDDRIINTWPPFRELVSLGPDALPFLLDALDDQTPTKRVYHHGPNKFGSEYGMMSYGAELSANPLDPAEPPEVDIFSGGGDDIAIHEYTIKVGDVCFQAIGQIVGRSYHPARYQNTACIVINSPTHDPKFCAAIRKAWGSSDPRRRLFDSLRTDYATDPADRSDERGGYWWSNEFQCSAATRLLYYFPKESTGLIAARLDHLDVTAKKAAESGMAAPVEFVKAVSWSNDPVVKAAIARIFARTDDPDVVLASAPAVDYKAVLTPRLLWAASTVPADLSTNNDSNRARWVVSTLIERIPDAAEAPIRDIMKAHYAHGIWMVSDALVESKVKWDIDLLGPMLQDKRETGPGYYIDGKTNPQLSRRICDNAAVTLASNHPELHFKLLGTHEDLDRQIAVMERVLAQPPNATTTPQ